MLICHDEAGVSAPLVDATPAIQGDTHGAGHAESPLGICQHGHCHHAVHYLSNAEAVAALDPEPAYRPLPAPAAFPAFDLAYGLKRPPRA